MATINYVKFLRGTPTAYANIVNKDADTLYFISEPNADHGFLYLGDKLIGDGQGNGGSSASALSALTDVVIDTIGDKQLLIYNNTTGKWENGFISDIIDVMVGATASTAGQSGLVPAPTAGDNNKFLRGDGTWAVVPQGEFDSNVFAKTTVGDLNTLLGFESAEAGTLLQKGADGKIKWVSDFYTKDEINNLLAGHLTRKKVDSIESINPAVADAESFIYLVPNGESDGNNLYDEYIVVDGAIEKMSQGTFDGSDYVTNVVYQAQVGNLAQLLKEDGATTLVDQVNVLTNRLTWQELTE